MQGWAIISILGGTTEGVRSASRSDVLVMLVEVIFIVRARYFRRRGHDL